MTGKFKSGRAQPAQIEAKTTPARGPNPSGMNPDDVLSLMSQPTKIERVADSKKEQWSYESPDRAGDPSPGERRSATRSSD